MMDKLSTHITDENPVSSWEMVEEDPWTTRFKSRDYEIEVYFYGDNSQPEGRKTWEVSLYDVREGRYRRLEIADIEEIEDVVEQAAEYAANSESYLREGHAEGEF